MFSRQRDYYAIAIAFCWLGTNLFDVATYAGDARARQLPLVSVGGGDPEHDWFIMLLDMNLLNYDTVVGGLFRFAGVLSFVVGLGFGATLLQQMRVNPKPSTAE